MLYQQENNKQQQNKLKRSYPDNLNDHTVWHQSLNFKFVLIIVVLISTSMSFVIYLNYKNELSRLNDDLSVKGKSLARITSLAAVDGILAFDNQSLEKAVSYLNNENDVAYAVVYSSNNESLTRYLDASKDVIQETINKIKSDSIDRIVSYLKLNNSIIHVTHPVTYKHFELGYIAIGMSRQNIVKQSSEILQSHMVETFFLVLILSGTIFFIFKVSTVKPIRDLIEGLSRVSKGELNYYVEVDSENELGKLARSFNRMVFELRQVHKEKEEALYQLEDLNNDLALDVEARSHALSQVNKELEYVVKHDSLTQLPNRDSFFKEASFAIERARQNGTMVGLIMMDIDSFKEINETNGHDIGDEILITIADRLKDTIRGNDSVGRLGGDEFVVLIDNITEEQLKFVATKIAREIEPVVNIRDKKFYITASMGLALFPKHAHTTNDLLRCADIAMYKSKERKDIYTVYDDTLEVKKVHHVDLLGGLRTAIQENQFYLEYQPKVDINKGMVAGVEALIRWKHPQRGVIPPYEFIGLAENTGLIKPVTNWVLKEAIKQNSLWGQQGLKLSVSVNLSMLNLEDELLPATIHSLLDEYRMPANQLVLEVTETMIMANPNQVMGTLTKLHEMGVHLSIDDFGTGYSSLSYLHKLPVDEVKIDRSFVSALSEDNLEKSIVHSIIELGHNLSLSVVAEGVEDVATVLLLSKLQCDQIQGFYFSKPLLADDLSRFCVQSKMAETIKHRVNMH